MHNNRELSENQANLNKTYDPLGWPIFFQIKHAALRGTLGQEMQGLFAQPCLAITNQSPHVSSNFGRHVNPINQASLSGKKST